MSADHLPASSRFTASCNPCWALSAHRRMHCAASPASRTLVAVGGRLTRHVGEPELSWDH